MKLLGSGLILILSLVLLTANTSLARTRNINISQAIDDAEERHSDGAIEFGDSALELVVDDDSGRGQQVIGLYFRKIKVPKYATIVSAEIEFAVDEVEDDDNVDGTLHIAAAADANPPEISSDDHNLSSRVKTSATVDWVLDGDNRWGKGYDTDGNPNKKSTPNLKSIVQEIIDRPGWNDKQNMLFIIDGSSGKRVACAYSDDNHANGRAAKLHIEFERGAAAPIIDVTPVGSLGATSYEGMNARTDSFELTNIGNADLNYTLTDDAAWFECTQNCSGTLSADSSIAVEITYSNSTMDMGNYTGHISIVDDNARNSPFEYDVILLIEEFPTGTTCGEVPIYAQNLVDPALLVLLDVSGSMKSLMSVVDEDENPITPDISTIIQELVDRTDWTSGNSMAVMLSGSGTRVAESYDGEASAAPRLLVEYAHDGLVGNVDIRVIQSNDDAEEYQSGRMYTDSSDLELVTEGSSAQTIGIRFQDIQIPNGATINSAYIQFTVDEADFTSETNISIVGEATGDAQEFEEIDNNISDRIKTSAAVPWQITEQWQQPPKVARYIIGREVISELVEDETISWGVGTWSFTGHDGPSSRDLDLDRLPDNPYGEGEFDLYTKILGGVKRRDTAETATFKALIETITATGGTPFGPSLLAAQEYFNGNKQDEDGDKYDSSLSCQPKFLIDITDGLGYLNHTSVDIINRYTNLLADSNINSVAVGFGIDDATQILEMARVANMRGEENDLYALHEADMQGMGVPFIAQNKAELLTALHKITNSIKQQIFIGSSPAPSTSVDSGTFVINAEFNAATWDGGLTATPYDPTNGAMLMCVDNSGQQTCNPAMIYGKCPDNESKRCSPTNIQVGECLCWDAVDVMPVVKNSWTVDGDLSHSGASLSPGTAGQYVADHTNLGEYEIGLSGDNYVCKDLGDIIKSTPIIVEAPHKYYSFDSYTLFKYGSARSRPDQLYVGANDGALHAFDLQSGIESWRFYPEALHQKIIDTDICSSDYCHEYFVDGTPFVTDVYLGTDNDTYTDTKLTGTGWRSVLISGLGDGGDAYFALDVTSGKTFIENNTDPLIGATYLWQFTDPELGFAVSSPATVRIEKSSATFGGWATYFGSGYAADGSVDKEAYVYGIKTYTMENLWNIPSDNDSTNRVKLEVTDGVYLDDALSDPLVADIDFDGFGDHLYIGSLYGRMHRLTDIESGSVPSKDLFFEINPLTSPSSSSVTQNTPIRAGAAIAYDVSPNTVWVYFGTGKFEKQIDKFNSEQQYFIALQDNLDSPVVNSNLTKLLERDTVSATITVNNTEYDFRLIIGQSYAYNEGGGSINPGAEMVGVTSGATGTIDSLTTVDGVKVVKFVESTLTGAFAIGEQIVDATDASNYVILKSHPWYAKLQANGGASERVITSPLVVGGIVFFATFVPDNDPCGGNGTAWLYALDYETGLPPIRPVFDLNDDGVFDSDDSVTYDDGKKYIPVGISIGRGLPSSAILEGDVLFMNATGGEQEALKVNLPKLQAKLSTWKDSGF